MDETSSTVTTSNRASASFASVMAVSSARRLGRDPSTATRYSGLVEDERATGKRGPPRRVHIEHAPHNQLSLAPRFTARGWRATRTRRPALLDERGKKRA